MTECAKAEKLLFFLIYVNGPCTLSDEFAGETKSRSFKFLHFFKIVLLCVHYPLPDEYYNTLVFILLNTANLIFLLKLNLLYTIFSVCLILYVPSTIFQLNRDGSSWVEPVRS